MFATGSRPSRTRIRMSTFIPYRQVLVAWLFLICIPFHGNDSVKIVHGRFQMCCNTGWRSRAMGVKQRVSCEVQLLCLYVFSMTGMCLSYDNIKFILSAMQCLDSSTDRRLAILCHFTGERPWGEPRTYLTLRASMAWDSLITLMVYHSLFKIWVLSFSCRGRP